MADDVVQLCSASGPGIAPDPAIFCQLPAEHAGRHEWQGRTAAGNQKMAWGSTGPGPAGCGALPLLLAEGDELPGFHCLRDPSHDGAHHWRGATVKGADASVDWIGGQMVVLVGVDAHMLDAAGEGEGSVSGDRQRAGEGAEPAAAPPPPPAARKRTAKKVTAAKKAAAKRPAQQKAG